MTLTSRQVPADLRPRATIAAQRLQPDALFRLLAARELHAWLLHDGSLTDRIGRSCGTVHVRPDRESDGLPSALEAGLLRQARRGGWWLREITLYAGGTARLRARTLVPPCSTVLRTRLMGLGSTPLGRVLFRADRLRPEVRRGDRGFYRNDAGDWLRATAYEVRGEPLLVIERPLPALLRP
ncbi:MAG TPA: chorismate lyase [Pseudomonadales bacterium]|nr:chorismate lyase [Pseudomonadales bacterium]